MIRFTKPINYLSIFLFVFLTIFFLSCSLYTSGGEEQYSLLSESILKGKLYFTRLPINMADTVFHEGNYYWPNPIFPAILLLPFTLILSLFGLSTYQVYISIPIAILLIFLLFKLFEMYSDNKDAYFWVYGFIFSTCFIVVVSLSWSWYTAHLVAVFLNFLAIFLYKKGKSLITIGILYGLIFLTRPTASLGIIFIALSIIWGIKFNFKPIKENFYKIFALFIPLLLAIFITLGYNYLRYETIKDLGYTQNNLLNPTLQENRSFGVFSLKHIPGNLYYMFLSGPKPIYRNENTKLLKFPFLKADPWGMSIFLTSPYLLLLFTFDYKKNKEAILLLITSIIIMIPILLYFGIGFRQFGYRYSLDFLPYVYIAFVSEYTAKNKRISNRLKALFMIVSITNLFLFMSAFS